jgi:hypothetical protein
LCGIAPEAETQNGCIQIILFLGDPPDFGPDEVMAMTLGCPLVAASSQMSNPDRSIQVKLRDDNGGGGGKNPLRRERERQTTWHYHSHRVNIDHVIFSVSPFVIVGCFVHTQLLIGQYIFFFIFSQPVIPQTC